MDTSPLFTVVQNLWPPICISITIAAVFKKKEVLEKASSVLAVLHDLATRTLPCLNAFKRDVLKNTLEITAVQSGGV